MDYETFKQEMTEDLKQRLYERGVEDVEMSFHNIRNGDAEDPFLKSRCMTDSQPFP